MKNFPDPVECLQEHLLDLLREARRLLDWLA